MVWTVPWSVGVGCPGCVPSQLSVPPACSLGGEERSREGLSTVQALLRNYEDTSVLSTLFLVEIQNIALYRLLQRNSTLSQPQPVQSFQSGKGGRDNLILMVQYTMKRTCVFRGGNSSCWLFVARSGSNRGESRL